MLTGLRIDNMGVIESATLELSGGYSVITGETGAGKTMVVTGLTLLLGGRADAGIVRRDAERAQVEGVFEVPADGPAAVRALEAGADLDEDAGPDGDGLAGLIVSRAVSRTGRGRAHVGGRSTPVATLTDLADHLVTLHGQSDQIMLRSPARQRDLLDRYGGPGLVTLREEYTGSYRQLQQVSAELEEITGAVRARRQEADVLRAGVAEIEQVDPQPGEDTELAALADRLTHAEDLRIGTAVAAAHLAGDESAPDAAGDVLTALAAARRALGPVVGHDPALAALDARIREISALTADVAADLSSYHASVDADPARLATVQDRRAQLTALQRKYGDTLQDVLDWARQAGDRLLTLDSDDDRIAELTTRRQELHEQTQELAARLTAARGTAADALAAAVTAELAALAMPNATFSVCLRPGVPGPSGHDEIEFQLAPHRGADPRPLAKGASGGELSRVMLAVEVATAACSGTRTLVFDEVDAGVGGRAALQIGKRLAALAGQAQVIVVTHLPQVAAFADRHLVVEKAQDGQVTASGVRQVEGEDRLRELARMLAGQEDSTAAREHAAELLALAEDGRRARG